MVRLTLPVPPPLNRTYRIQPRRSRPYKRTADRQYADMVRMACALDHITPFLGPVAVAIKWYRARKAGDIDGRWKTLLDALQGYAYRDDKQIEELFIRRLDDDPRHPRIEITIKGVRDDEDKTGKAARSRAARG